MDVIRQQLAAGATVLPHAPVTPDAPDARDLLTDELSKPEYAAAQPTLFDIISQAFFDWLERVFTPGEALPADWLILVAVIVVVAAIVIAIVIWGVPRRNRRRSTIDALFGEDDIRSAAELRASAAAAAQRGDFSTAVIEQYRALARGLSERTVIVVAAGSTAHDVARRAGLAFPQHRTQLGAAAADFDRVRYLDSPGTAAQYELSRTLDNELSRLAPAHLDEVGEVAL